jgi:organic hydroperoxide reductase OsmC/OhrA
MTFKAIAYWKVGTRGTAECDPAAKAIEFAAPVELGGESGVWSPEHLLLAAVASCFVSTFKTIAASSKFEAVSLGVVVKGVVEKGEGGYAFTHVVLTPELTVNRESDRHRGMELLEKTERACLIARSLKASVTMPEKVGIVLEEVAA